MKCCKFINNYFFLHFHEDHIWARPCWFGHKYKIHFSLKKDFFEELYKMRQYFIEHQDEICKECFVPRDKEFEEKLKERSLILNLKSSTICNIKCPYC